MNRRSLVLAGAAGLLGRPWSRAGLGGERLVDRWSWAMGQPVRLRLFAVDEAAGLEIAAAVFAEIRRVEAVLSLFDETSDLVALNQRAGRGSVRVSRDLTEVLRYANSLREATGGGFDVAVEPLMRSWGFHRRPSSPPSAAELREARRLVKATRIEVGQDGRVRLDPGEARLDLGGIGVGYGLDRAAAVLRARGIRRALLDVSGDLIALEGPPGLDGWPIEIARPDGLRPAPVPLRFAALATSSSQGSVVRYAGVLTGHVLDPASGAGARALAQVTTLASTGVLADAGSTARLVSARRLAGVTVLDRVPLDT